METLGPLSPRAIMLRLRRKRFAIRNVVGFSVFGRLLPLNLHGSRRRGRSIQEAKCENEAVACDDGSKDKTCTGVFDNVSTGIVKGNSEDCGKEIDSDVAMAKKRSATKSATKEVTMTKKRSATKSVTTTDSAKRAERRMKRAVKRFIEEYKLREKGKGNVRMCLVCGNKGKKGKSGKKVRD